MADGKMLWRANRPGRPSWQTAVVPTPVYSENLIYVTSGYGVGCNLFKISKGADSLQTEQIYASKNMINHHGGVILFDNHIYGFSDGKGWVCQDFRTGEVLWSYAGVGKGTIIYADEHFYIRVEAGNGPVALIEATPKGYVEKGRFDQPDRSSKNTWAYLAIANGKLYIRDQGVLLCYDVRAK